VRAEHALDTIVDAIAADLGRAMARASVMGLARRVGITGATASGEQVSRLLDELAPGLAVFLGRATASETVAKLRKHLAGIDGGSL
jgi:hypothetical protein